MLLFLFYIVTEYVSVWMFCQHGSLTLRRVVVGQLKAGLSVYVGVRNHDSVCELDCASWRSLAVKGGESASERDQM